MSHSSEAGKYKIKVPIDPVFGDVCFLACRTATFSPYAHKDESKGGDCKLSCVSSFKDTNPIHEGATLMT